MPSEHTPTPWNYSNPHEGVYTLCGAAKDPDDPTPTYPFIAYWERQISEENLRRAVACVNACEGFSNEALETGVLKDLLDAARLALHCEGLLPHNRTLLEAAIAKAESSSSDS